MSTIIEPNRAATDAPTGILRRLPWRKILWIAGVFIGLALFLALYYRATFIGLADKCAMDISQIATQLHSHHSYKTLFLRPLNVAIIDNPDSQMSELNTAPLFPCAVAFLYSVKGGASDQCVVWVSMLFMLLTLVATYILGREIFDWKTGLLAAAVVGISESVLRTAISGTEWPMAAFFFVMLLLAVVMHHRSVMRGSYVLGYCCAGACAVLLALLFMTNHILLGLIVPLVIYFATNRYCRAANLIVFLVVAMIAVAPWAYRNASLARGSIIGASAWDIMANTIDYPGDQIYRITDPVNLSLMRCILFPIEHFESFASKLMSKSAELANSLASILGLVVLPFAVVSIMYRFKSESANLLRWFAYGSVVLLIAIFAAFSVDARALVLFAPIVGVYGAAYFFLLMDSKGLHIIYVRMLTAALIIITCWQACSTVLWNHNSRANSDVLNSSEYFVSLADAQFRGLVYTDVPWVAALRMGTPAVWLPVKDSDILAMSNVGIPMQVVVITSESDKYPTSEAWYLIHKSELWRDYVRNSQECMKSFAERSRPPEEFMEKFSRYMRERKRSISAVGSLNGFAERDPGSVRVLSGSVVRAVPDDIIVLTGNLSK